MTEKHRDKYRRGAHTVYQCKHHIVRVPRYCYWVLEGTIKEVVEKCIRVLCGWREVEVMELNVQPDHAHLVCSIPLKMSVSDFMGFLKGG